MAPDGSLWVTEQAANKLGGLDPKTGAFREFPLETPDSGPHGLVADKSGSIWFTANYKGYIGKLDPRTGKITEYKMPDEKAEDPHTPAFAPHGTLWFTAQDSNFVGRLDPRTLEIHEYELPSGARPRLDGTIYHCAGFVPAAANAMTTKRREIEMPGRLHGSHSLGTQERERKAGGKNPRRLYLVPFTFGLIFDSYALLGRHRTLT